MLFLKKIKVKIAAKGIDIRSAMTENSIIKFGVSQVNFPKCFRCGADANQWFDGIGAQEKGIARAICQRCEHQDWKRSIKSLNVEIG